MSNTYSIANVLGEADYNGTKIVNIFNKIDLFRLRNDLTMYDEYNVTNEDRWDLISLKFYGSPHLWWLIATYNEVIDPFSAIQDLEKIKILKREYIPTLMLQLKGYI